MFEYLMPLLVMPSTPFSLLDQTHRAAVKRHIAYGRARHVPWGISESAYNVRDRHDTYQYRGFGVPDLALKRGLANELVVAPYATVLALPIDLEPGPAAIWRGSSARARSATTAFTMRSTIRAPTPTSTMAVVRTSMAHHVGMSLVAIDNALHVVRRRRDLAASLHVRSVVPGRAAPAR